MRTPRFWYPADGGVPWQAALLRPLGALYAAGTKRRLRKGPTYRAGVPVLCVGNVNAGGTGKTPTAIAMAERLVARGLSVAIVSRGYKGREAGPLQVDPARHSAEDVGDEPLLLAAFAPTWVARDRAEGVKAAEVAGAQIILLDDGLQSPAVAKDAAIIVVDAARGFGNGLMVPAGPLREPIAAAQARADLVLTVGDEAAQSQFDAHWASEVTLPRVRAHLEPLNTGMPWAGLRVLAFAGIGHPEKFFQTVRGLGADLVHAEPLGDHQALTPALMARLERDAKAHAAQLVTTEKDAVRLPDTFRSKVLTVPVRLIFDDPGPIDALLDRLNPG
ncbi:MAG: tetraacyldisaccharide 4'-kinase [Pseudomonadota bacterium]